MSKTKSPIARDSLRKLNANIFRRAAERIKNKDESYTCHALSAEGARDYYDPHKWAYREAFAPKTYAEEKGHFWNQTATPARQNDRYTALLLMAAMVDNAKANRGKKKSKKERDIERIVATLPHVPDPSSQWPFPLES
jgi:mannitol-1-phosphate/altronate dehydrogenase